MFLTRNDLAKSPKHKRRPIREETWKRLGKSVSGSVSKTGVEPIKPQSPEDACSLYVVGAWPTESECKAGKPFSNRGGKLLRTQIGVWGCRRASFNYCVPVPISGRWVDGYAVAYRDDLYKSIAKQKPMVVLLVGDIPTKTILGAKSVLSARGRRFPMRFGKHACTAVPVYDPSWILSIQKGRYNKVPGKEWLEQFERDVAGVAEGLVNDEFPRPTVVTDKKVWSGVHVCQDHQQAMTALRRLKARPGPIGFDVETTGLRPYSTGAELLSIALSNGPDTYAIPLEHLGSKWSSSQLDKVWESLRGLFNSSEHQFVAHNLLFDLEWMAHYLGESILLSSYGCSQQVHYVLDPGPPGKGGHLSLDFICKNRFGLNLKEKTSAYGDITRLRQVDLGEVLRYNALDAKWCLAAWDKGLDEVEEEGLMEPYERQISRIPPIVYMQMRGVPIDEAVTRSLDSGFEAQAREIRAEIAELPEVQKYYQIGKQFNPDSSLDVAKFLVDFRKRSELVIDGKPTTAESVMSLIRDQEPVADLVLKLRSVTKLRGTYTERFLPEHPQTHIYPDKKIHASYSVNITRTSRLSSFAPNNQNWPKRKGKFVRSQMKAPSGYEFLSFDYGQIEARVIGCASQDKAWCSMIWDDYDIHMDWAEKVSDVHPPALEKWTGASSWRKANKDQRKTYRSIIKNRLVFPAFFGASVGSIADYLGIPLEGAYELFDEFWSVFRGVKVWQEKLWKFYQANHYVRSMTGRIRRAPMSFNMVCNTTIQGDASDIVTEGLERTAYEAIETGVPDLCPVMDIHDDLTFLTPIAERDWFLDKISTAMLRFDNSWITVPLVVEAEYGPNMADMEPCGVFKAEPEQ